ncbi:hypothetical protein E3E12_07480 [Formicincola oecophyllae]|uniref:Uracil-DNA glycosylase-like domain-containing protein n=1 Tax=Formicincola oecophyllae TaxID=2558361 RepID=A0A4Y6UA03_9PROT|nr:uracil-DNA glycosylase [Formicincola oecophyllae]QDH14044.1 hypothetical protein E3E12_07480 [Formicincola oecophyllae]
MTTTPPPSPQAAPPATMADQILEGGRDALLAALRLQCEWGCGEAVSDDMRLPPAILKGESQAARAAGPLALGEANRASSPQGNAKPQPTPAQAGEVAAARSWPDLATLMARDGGAGLARTATRLVAPALVRQPRLIVVMDGPAAESDRTGDAWAGEGGALLRQCLHSIDMDPGTVSLLPALPWRPPGDRPPQPAEMKACAPFLLRQLALATTRAGVSVGGSSGQPPLLVLGAYACQMILGREVPFAQRRGQWAQLERSGPLWRGAPQTSQVEGPEGQGESPPLAALAVMVSYHPLQLQASPNMRRLLWDDLRALRRHLGGGVLT